MRFGDRDAEANLMGDLLLADRLLADRRGDLRFKKARTAAAFLRGSLTRDRLVFPGDHFRFDGILFSRATILNGAFFRWHRCSSFSCSSFFMDFCQFIIRRDAARRN